MQTPGRGRKVALRTPDSPFYEQPSGCCWQRPLLLEHSILFGILILFTIVDIGLWILGAYTLLAAMILIFIVHCLIILPAIFLPLLITKAGVNLKKLVYFGIFHKYDWNIAWSVVGIASSTAILVLILFTEPLFFRWTHSSYDVHSNVTYASAKPYSRFVFDHQFYVNISMMGESISLPIGDPTGSGVYYNCFAPILLKKSNGPNLFWAACPFQKNPCQQLLNEKSSCLSAWKSKENTGITWTSDVEYLLREPIREQAQIWELPPSPPTFITIRWENIEEVYKRTVTIFWVTILVSNLFVLFWFAIRRPFLNYCCGSFETPAYTQLN